MEPKTRKPKCISHKNSSLDFFQTYTSRCVVYLCIFLYMKSTHNYHPKTLFEMWITCLNRVSANSEKGRGSEWAVRVGQRLQSRFGKSRAARKSGLVQNVVEVSTIRGGLPSTEPFEPVFGWRGRSVLRDYIHGLLFGTACINYTLLR